MGNLDEHFVEEAAPQRRVRRGRLAAVLVAACLALVLLIPGGYYLFTPLTVEQPPALSDFEESEYFPIISMLYDYTPRTPVYKNNFDRLLTNFQNGIGNLLSFVTNLGSSSSGGDIQYAPPAAGDVGASGVLTPNLGKPGEYVEITDNQVPNVIEADLIKRSSTRIYYLNGRTLYIYRIDGEKTECMGQYTLSIEKASENVYNSSRTVDMYLSSDDRTVTLVSTCYNSYTKIVNLDVSDPESIRETDSILIGGSSITTRSVDGKLLVITNFFPGHNYSEESSFVPQIDMGSGLESIPMDSIIYPESMSTRRYTVVCQVDQATLNYEGSAAFFSYTTESLFISGNSIYLMRTYRKQISQQGGVAIHKLFTDISRLSFGKAGFAFHDPITVEGAVNNRYCIDEYNDMLRVVTETKTTTGIYKVDVDENGNEIGLGKPISIASDTSANLYCIDLATGEVINEVIGFAPQDETVESVRFDGDFAYVCTAKVVTMTDPVFFFDLSDPMKITYKQTAEIDGYSSSLISMGDGSLLGIGVGKEWGSLKIEVYREEERRVVSICSFELKDCTYSSNYRAYYIDRKKGLIGLGIRLDDPKKFGDRQVYLLLHFDGESLNVLLAEPLAGYCDYQRGVYIDGFFYMFGGNQYKVVPLSLTE